MTIPSWFPKNMPVASYGKPFARIWDEKFARTSTFTAKHGFTPTTAALTARLLAHPAFDPITDARVTETIEHGESTIFVLETNAAEYDGLQQGIDAFGEVILSRPNMRPRSGNIAVIVPNDAELDTIRDLYEEAGISLTSFAGASTHDLFDSITTGHLSPGYLYDPARYDHDLESANVNRMKALADKNISTHDVDRIKDEVAELKPATGLRIRTGSLDQRVHAGQYNSAAERLVQTRKNLSRAQAAWDALQAAITASGVLHGGIQAIVDKEARRLGGRLAEAKRVNADWEQRVRAMVPGIMASLSELRSRIEAKREVGQADAEEAFRQNSWAAGFPLGAAPACPSKFVGPEAVQG